jgi:hypothetical protein
MAQSSPFNREDAIMIIGLAGFAGAGKDTAAEALIAAGWERRAFADPLKDIARDLGWNGEKDDHGRRLLQTLGQSVRAHLGAHVWIDATLDDIEPGDRVVVTDVRYPNEAAAIRQLGGVLVRIERPGVGPANDHPSEHALDRYRFDFQILNAGTVADLHAEMLGLVAPPVDGRILT